MNVDEWEFRKFVRFSEHLRLENRLTATYIVTIDTAAGAIEILRIGEDELSKKYAFKKKKDELNNIH